MANRYRASAAVLGWLVVLVLVAARGRHQAGAAWTLRTSQPEGARVLRQLPATTSAHWRALNEAPVALAQVAPGAGRLLDVPYKTCECAKP